MANARLPLRTSLGLDSGGTICATICAVIAAVLTGCSSGGTSDVVAAGTSGKRPLCVDVPAEVLSHLAAGVRPGRIFRPDRGTAVQSTSGVYVIAAHFVTHGGHAKVGVWTAPALTATASPLLVADEVSSEVTTWSTVEEFPAYGVPLTSPDIAAARTCLRS